MSWLYNNFVRDCAVGNINTNTDTFRLLLLSPAHTPSRTHSRRSDVIGNEVTGTNYTAGGNIITVTTTTDNANNRTTISLSQPSWATLTVAAGIRYGAVYKARGGAANLDELVALLNFGSTFTPSATTFSTTQQAPFYINHAI